MFSEDNFSGRLSDERFKILSADYGQEQRDIRFEITDIQKQVNEAESKVIKVDSFLKMASKYTSFEELSRGMLHDLIEKIVIHEGDKSSGHRQQKIDIYYNLYRRSRCNAVCGATGTERKSSVTYSRTLRCLTQN